MSDRRWVSTELDEDVHRALVLLATEKGVHPSTLVEEYITSGLIIAAEAEWGEAAVDLKVFAGAQFVKRKSRVRAQLTQIAFEHTQHPTEETADMLRSLCELAGVAVEDLLDSVKDALEVPLVQDDGSGVSSAMSFLQSIVEKGEEYSVTWVYNVGKQRGFSEYILRTAKGRLGIVSRRKANEWVWTWPEGEEDIASSLPLN